MLDQIDMALAQLQDIRNKIAAREAETASAAEAIAAADAAKARFEAMQAQLIAAVGTLTAQLQSLGG